MPILLYMQIKIDKDGIKRDGKQRMVARLVFMEPELWNRCEELGKLAGETRSTYVRKLVKTSLKRCSKIEGIDWSEAK
jgi:hypothetical protein